jgi:ribosome-binding factor A
VSFKRAERVSEAIKREVSVLILQEMKDPDVTHVTVTDVETSDDLRHAKIFVSVMGDEAVKKRSMEGLERAKGYLRTEISRRLRLRYAPELQMKLDRTIDRAMRIEELLNDLKTREKGNNPSEPVE